MWSYFWFTLSCKACASCFIFSIVVEKWWSFASGFACLRPRSRDPPRPCIRPRSCDRPRSAVLSFSCANAPSVSAATASVMMILFMAVFLSCLWSAPLPSIPKNATVKAQMTYDSANQVYKYTVSANGTVPQYSYVAFCKDNQYNYDYFYATEASYRGDLSDYTKPKFTPDTTSNDTWNTSAVYYSNGSWSEL